jgi:hypothetical protein
VLLKSSNWRHDAQRNDSVHNDIQHKNATLSITLCRLSLC